MAKEHRNALPQGTQLDDYQVERILGAGGFGITYLAREKTLDRYVAIKEFLPRDLAVRGEDGNTIHPISDHDQEDFEYGLERFRDEARTLVNFRHPNIMPVHRLMEKNGTAYLIMEYEDGDSLDQILARDSTLTEDEIKEILLPILDGLEQVHKAGFLHRDIKPGNIYIRRDGSPVLIDFGAARQALGAKSRSMTAVVSVGYAPMEQYSERSKQNAATDLYALAATAYRAATGLRTPDAIERLDNDPLVPAVEAGKGKHSEAFLQAIDWGLAPDMKNRPQSVAEWRAALTGTGPIGVPGQAAGATIVAGAGDDATMPAKLRDQTGDFTGPLTGGDVTGPMTGGDVTMPPGQGGGSKVLPMVLGGVAVLLFAGAAAGGWFWYDTDQKAKLQAESHLAAKRQAAAAAEERRKAEEAKRRAEAERSKASEEARRRATADEARRKTVEEARRRAEEERRKRLGEQARRREETARRRREEAERRRREEAERRRRQAALTVPLRITIINKCYKSINVAYRYLLPNGAWVTRGWYVVRPNNQTSWTIRTRSRTFYLWAESTDRRMVWSGKGRSGSVYAQIVYRRFRHTTGTLRGPRRKSALFARKVVRPQFTGFRQSYTCR